MNQRDKEMQEGKAGHHRRLFSPEDSPARSAGAGPASPPGATWPSGRGTPHLPHSHEPAAVSAVFGAFLGRCWGGAAAALLGRFWGVSWARGARAPPVGPKCRMNSLELTYLCGAGNARGTQTLVFRNTWRHKQVLR